MSELTAELQAHPAPGLLDEHRACSSVARLADALFVVDAAPRVRCRRQTHAGGQFAPVREVAPAEDLLDQHPRALVADGPQSSEFSDHRVLALGKLPAVRRLDRSDLILDQLQPRALPLDLRTQQRRHLLLMRVPPLRPVAPANDNPRFCPALDMGLQNFRDRRPPCRIAPKTWRFPQSRLLSWQLQASGSPTDSASCRSSLPRTRTRSSFATPWASNRNRDRAHLASGDHRRVQPCGVGLPRQSQSRVHPLRRDPHDRGGPRAPPAPAIHMLDVSYGAVGGFPSG
jgi:hypothetical protein